MSQAGIINLNGGGGSGAPVETITGNDGVAEAPVNNNFNILTANATPQFKGTAGTETLDFSVRNLILGTLPLSITSASSNVGIGSFVLSSLTSGSANICMGNLSGTSLTGGSNNCFYGTSSGQLSTTTGNNCAFGNLALEGLQTGSGSNVAIGNVALFVLTTGANNIAIGQAAGGNYSSSETGNIIIGNTGTTGESSVIRLGTSQTKCFISGIIGNTISNTQFVSVNSVTGQLGVLPFTSFSQVNRQVFTASATYTPTAGTLYCDVEIVGGGAGGGGAVASVTGSSAGGAGGAGGYARKIFPVASATGQTVTIGAGGAGGAAGLNVGIGGSPSVFGVIFEATGGAGGQGGANAATTASLQVANGGVGGTGVGQGGDFGSTGQNGGDSFAFLTVYVGGAGGNSIYGSGARAPIASLAGGINGANASLYGSGGSGGVDLGGNTARSGGNGSAGICIITEYGH